MKRLAFAALLLSACTPTGLVEVDVAVPMRDGTILRADVLRPIEETEYPVLVYRTPYGKAEARQYYSTFQRAVERGYAVVVQDVRGRYRSEGEFDPYRQEGRDGFDTIEWAAEQEWSNGNVGTFGLSYPGAVQWLAALEQPPHLKAMVPAMTYSSPHRFFYSGGIFDLSWIPWIWNNIAPDARVRKNLPGPRDGREARRLWPQERDRLFTWLPLNTLPLLRHEAPFYFEWMRRPPQDPWWDWAELEGKYDRVDAAVLNISGWYDEAYGPGGAVRNFQGLIQERAGWEDPKTRLILGPWNHGVSAISEVEFGVRRFDERARMDYDRLVLDWMDRYLKEVDNGVDRLPRVQAYLMGEERWLQGPDWPPRAGQPRSLYLAGGLPGEIGALLAAPQGERAAGRLYSDPARPVVNPFGDDYGPYDMSGFQPGPSVLVFETEPLGQPWDVLGFIEAEIFFSCDCRDADLWVRLLEVTPDGRVYDLMSPGMDAQRASYLEGGPIRRLLEPGEIYWMHFENLLTGNRFAAGSRVRILILPSFFPHLSRNLQTGKLETTSSETREATLTIHHNPRYPSKILLPVIE